MTDHAGRMRIPDLDLDLVREPPDHLAERQHLFFTVAARDQKIGRVPERALAAFGRAAQDRLVEILQI